MANFPRYAIYFTAAQGSALDQFGSALLGYDAYGGGDLRFPDGLPPDWRELTQDARKYGFHATLKAPIALADGKAEARLAAACELFADLARPVPVIQPVVDAISGFIAVIPASPSVELAVLAAEATKAFDPFRAPLAAEDRARRNPDRLTPRQRDYLDRWGYPYVFDEFRFHMTLTTRLPAERREAVLAMLRERFAATGVGPLAIDAISLCRQDAASSRFRVIGRWQLHDGSAPYRR
jgi:putative phosphonate metabolism protein